MNRVLTPIRPSQLLTALAVNSEPLSERMCSGGPYKKIREAVKHIIGGDLPCHYDHQSLPGVLVDDGQHFDCPSIVCPIYHEIIGPDMVAMHGPKAGTGSVIKPQPTPFGLFLWNLEPLLTPDTLHTLVVDLPTIPS